MRATTASNNGDAGGQAPRPAVGARRRLQEALLACRVSGAALVRRLPTTATSKSNPEPAAERHPELRQPASTATRPSAATAAPAASCWTPSCSAASTSATCRCSVKLGRHTLYWGESLFLGGNLHSVAYAQDAARPAEGLCHARHRSQGTVPPAEPAVGAGAGDRHAVGGRRSTCSSGSPPAIRKAAPTWARWTSRSTARTASSSRPRSASPSRGNAAEPGSTASAACRPAGAPDGSTAPMGLYYRNFADKLPQTLLTQVGRERQPLQPDLRRQHRPATASVSAKNIGGVSIGAELSLPPQHAAQQRRCSALRRACPARATPRARAATPTHGLVNARGHGRQDAACSTPRPGRPSCMWSQLGQGHAAAPTCSTRSASRRAAGQRRQVGRLHDQELLRHRPRRSRPPGSRCSRASTCRRRSPTRSASPATRRPSSAATRALGNYSTRRRRRRAAEVPLRPRSTSTSSAATRTTAPL